VNAPNKLTPKMLAAYLDCSLDWVNFMIDHWRVKTENWYGEVLVDEAEARRLKNGIGR